MAEKPHAKAKIVKPPHLICQCVVTPGDPQPGEAGDDYLGGLRAHEIGYAAAAMIADISRTVGELAEQFNDPEILEHFQGAMAENALTMKGEAPLEEDEDAPE